MAYPIIPPPRHLLLFSTCCGREEPRGRFLPVATSSFPGVGPRPAAAPLLGAPRRPGEWKPTGPVCKSSPSLLVDPLASFLSVFWWEQPWGYGSSGVRFCSGLTRRQPLLQMGGTSGFLIPILIMLC